MNCTYWYKYFLDWQTEVPNRFYPLSFSFLCVLLDYKYHRQYDVLSPFQQQVIDGICLGWSMDWYAVIYRKSMNMIFFLPSSPTSLLLCESGINPRCPLQYEKQKYFGKQNFWRHQALGFHQVNQTLASSPAYLGERVAARFFWESVIKSGNFCSWVNKSARSNYRTIRTGGIHDQDFLGREETTIFPPFSWRVPSVFYKIRGSLPTTCKTLWSFISQWRSNRKIFLIQPDADLLQVPANRQSKPQEPSRGCLARIVFILRIWLMQARIKALIPPVFSSWATQ